MSETALMELADLLVEDAIAMGATDIHLNPNPAGVSLRYRVDGRLTLVRDFPLTLQKLLPEAVARQADKSMQVSVLETPFGPNVVVRVLEREPPLLALSDTGMDAVTLERWRQAVRSPAGLSIITGPTGSGKTTTAYGTLVELAGPSLNIVSLEDPVEATLQWVVQSALPPDGEFAAALKVAFRQDPDVIFCAEIRDLQTAEQLCKMAMTGHQVLTIMHAPDAASAVSRLLGLGVPSHLLSACLVSILSQRLIRRLCPEGPCAACQHTGYRGRIGLFHLETNLRPLFDGSDLRPNGLREDGERKVRDGITTLEELHHISDV